MNVFGSLRGSSADLSGREQCSLFPQKRTPVKAALVISTSKAGCAASHRQNKSRGQSQARPPTSPRHRSAGRTSKRSQLRRRLAQRSRSPAQNGGRAEFSIGRAFANEVITSRSRARRRDSRTAGRPRTAAPVRPRRIRRRASPACRRLPSRRSNAAPGLSRTPRQRRWSRP